MKSKEFEEKYIKDNRTEEKKIRDMIHSQAKTRRMNELMDKQIKELEEKQKDRRNSMIATFIIAGLFLTTIVFGYFYTKASIEQCVSAGHSESWCIRND